jgi:hypothetical protein
MKGADEESMIGVVVDGAGDEGTSLNESREMRGEKSDFKSRRKTRTEVLSPKKKTKTREQYGNTRGEKPEVERNMTDTGNIKCSRTLSMESLEDDLLEQRESKRRVF